LLDIVPINIVVLVVLYAACNRCVWGVWIQLLLIVSHSYLPKYHSYFKSVNIQKTTSLLIFTRITDYNYL